MKHVPYTYYIMYLKVSQTYVGTECALLSIKGGHISVMCGVRYQLSVHCPKSVQLSWNDVRILPGSGFEPRTLRIQLSWDWN